MKIYYPVVIDLDYSKPVSRLKMKQLDSGRGLLVTLRSGGEIIDASSEVCTMYMVKPDGKRVYLAAEALPSGRVKVDFTNTSLSTAGTAYVEIQMQDGEDIVTTPIVKLIVDPTYISQDGIESDDEYTVLQELIAQFQAVASGVQSTIDENLQPVISELHDLRIAADGSSYPYAGDSVRNQFLMLGEKLGAYADADGYLYLTWDEETVAGPIGPFAGGGGGGGGGASSTVVMTNESGFVAKSIASGSSCELSFSWSSIEDELPTGDGILTITVNGAKKKTQTIAQGLVSVDVAGYLATGANTVRLTVTDSYGMSRYKQFSITVIAVSITSLFDSSIVQTDSISFTFTPIGAVSKIVHILVDNIEIATITTSASGTQQTYVIPAQTHGRHSIEAYFNSTVDDSVIESNHLYYEVICVTSDGTIPIIASDYHTSTVAQFATVAIPYRVYTPNSLTSDVNISVNGTQVASLNVDRSEQTFSYRVMDYGTVVIEFSSGSATKAISISVTETEIDVEAVTQNLELYLTASGRSNNEENPWVWEYNDISCSLTNFDGVTNGWITDADGVTVLRHSGNARTFIPFYLFAEDFRTTGKTIEIEFATSSVRNYDTTIISCFSGGSGIVMTPQIARLMSQQSKIDTQYKDDEHVRIAFVIQPRKQQRLIMMYINGIMSGVVQYPDEDDFSQADPVGITIGSSYCTTDIYCIRVYKSNLNRRQVLENWIADTQNVVDLLDRYNRNRVFDAYDNIVIEQLPNDLPYMVLQGAALPQSKGNKLTIAGYFIDPSGEHADFLFSGAQIDVQGTSSQFYARKNYKIKFRNGFTINGEASNTYKIREDSVPTNTFTFKADVASSEGANNVELARLYDDVVRNYYLTPPQIENSSIRQGIDGFPMVMFWDNGDTITFLGKYNFNNDKGTEKVFGLNTGDQSWEILNNTSNRVLFKSADFSGSGWENDFEARYPEDSKEVADLAAFSVFLVSTDQSQATGEALSESVTYGDTTYTTDSAEYRLAKFAAEIGDHAELDALIFYYLFTELYLMVDSRAKNMFPTKYAGDGWFSFPYDFDTAIGNNNEGALTFSYNLEDIDTINGADVFNGQQSVLWINIRGAFFEEIKAMYQEIRSKGYLSYSLTESRFETHQNKWPEAIFNEDSYFKYLQPLIDDGDGAYLSMLYGSKTEQRKWWLYNRFRYLDSKYNAGDALTDVITLRGYAKSNVVITPYADVYASVKYGSYLVQTRATRNNQYEMVCPLDNVNDTEIYIYSASQLSEIGDVSGFLVGYANFSMATKLVTLKIGDQSDGYSNGNLKELYLGNNILLRVLDVRNCVNLAQAVDISGCTNIEEVYFDGTAVSGVALPNGGVLRVLHLPATVTNLTIRNQGDITDFQMDGYSNLSTLRIENCSSAVDPIAILPSLAPSSRVRLIGFHTTVQTEDDIIDLMDIFDTMRGLDENGNNVDTAQISGTVFVDSVSGEVVSEAAERYPDLTIEYNSITCKLEYYNYNGTTLLHTETISNGGDGKYAGAPGRPQTEQYTYTFAGWSYTKESETADVDATKHVVSNRTVYAAYSKAVRTYTVRHYNGTVLVQTDNNVPYGGSAPYTGGELTYNGDGDPEDYAWTGEFSPSDENITGNTDCYATYRYTGSVTRPFILRTIKNVPESIAASISGIGSCAFQNCYALATASFPVATSIGEYAFYSCYALASVSFPVVTSIGPGAFYSCRALTSVSFPAATNIASSVFYRCIALTSASFPVATYVGSSMFYGCIALTSVSFPAVTSIGPFAFQNCYALTSVSFPVATSIGEYAFYKCYSLASVSFPVVTSIGPGAFQSCSALTTVSFPAVTSIGNSAFYSCYALASVSFPVVTSIGPGAFYSCRALTSVSFPAVTSIGDNAFYGCIALSAVTIGTSSVCYLATYRAFMSTPISTSSYLGYFGSIYVPSSLVDAYKSAANWSVYSNRITAIMGVIA